MSKCEYLKPEDVFNDVCGKCLHPVSNQEAEKDLANDYVNSVASKPGAGDRPWDWYDVENAFLAGRALMAKEVEELKKALIETISNLEYFHEYDEDEFTDIDWFEEEKKQCKELRARFSLGEVKESK